MAETDPNFEKILAQLEREEQKKNPSESTSESNSDYEFPHKEIMEQEGLKKKDLPEDLKKMVMSFDGKLSMAKIHNANEETFLQIQKLSAIIADKLMDYLEKDIMAKKEVSKEVGGEVKPEATPEVTPKAEITPEATPAATAEGSASDSSAVSDGIETSAEEIPKSESKGMFNGILGGILDW